MDEMMEYCHHILSKGKSISLYAAAPKDYKSKKDVLDRFDRLMDFSPKRWPAFNDKLTRSIRWLLDESGLLRIRYMGEDANSIYERCYERIPRIDHRVRPEGYIIDYEEVFEILSDFIWIYVSQLNCREKGSQKLTLIDDFQMLHHGVKELYKVFDEFICEAEYECKDIAEAEELRCDHRFLTAFIPGVIANDRVRWYCSSEIREDDFRQLKHEKEEYAEWMKYIYFALIATSVRFEEIRRG